MTALSYRHVIEGAVRHYGAINQQTKAIEELGELIVALSRYLSSIGDGSTRSKQVVEEIADCAIMLSQLGLIFGSDEVDAVVDEKIQRLHNRLSKQFGEAYHAFEKRDLR
jgi:phosphate uptake regulator